MRVIFFVGLLSLFLSACSTISQVKPDFINTPEERAYLALVQQTKTGQYSEAVVAADNYETEFPYSLQLQKARFQKALALEGLQRWEEAAETYLAISNFSKKSQPEIAALSVYRLSYVYEALGDNQRVLTSLYDAQRLEQYLPPEVGMAEIPARLAMAYTKENNPEEAKRWLEDADKGLKRALESRKEPLTSEWLARTYFNMGSVSTNQLTTENLLSTIQGQKVIQKYLIKALQYNDPIWSSQAAKKMKETYQALFAIVEKPEDNQDPDPAIATKNLRENQIKFAGPLVELIEQALLFQPAPDQISNAYQTEVFSYLRDAKVRAEKLLQDPIYTLPIRRDKGSPKRQTPDNVLKSEDPNI